MNRRTIAAAAGATIAAAVLATAVAASAPDTTPADGVVPASADIAVTCANRGPSIVIGAAVESPVVAGGGTGTSTDTTGTETTMTSGTTTTLGTTTTTDAAPAQAEPRAAITAVGGGVLEFPKQPSQGGAGGNPMISISVDNGPPEPLGRCIDGGGPPAQAPGALRYHLALPGAPAIGSAGWSCTQTVTDETTTQTTSTQTTTATEPTAAVAATPIPVTLILENGGHGGRHEVDTPAQLTFEVTLAQAPSC